MRDAEKLLKEIKDKLDHVEAKVNKSSKDIKRVLDEVTAKEKEPDEFKTRINESEELNKKFEIEIKVADVVYEIIITI